MPPIPPEVRITCSIESQLHRTDSLSPGRTAIGLTWLVCLIALVVPTSATAASTATLKLGAHDSAGSLRLTATTTGASTAVLISGSLRNRTSSIRLVAVRCAATSCAKSSRREETSRALRRGRAAVAQTLYLKSAAAVTVAVRSGRHTLASRRLIPVVRPLPALTPPPAVVAPAASPVPEAAPAALAVSTDPVLTPAYDAAITDYTVSCDPAVPVSVRVDLPSQTTARINSVAQSGDRVRTSVPMVAGQRLTIAITDAAGATNTANVRCLPADLTRWTVERDGEPQTPYVLFTTSIGAGGPYSVIADDHGVPVWWVRAPSGAPLDARVVGTRVIWGAYMVGATDEAHHSIGLDGSAQPSIAPNGFAGLDHHDLLPDGTGGWYGIAYPRRDHVDLTSLDGPSDATVQDAEIVHFTVAGDVDWTWKSQDHIALSETAAWGNAKASLAGGTATPQYDIVHMNSIEVDGDGIVFSARHLNAVYRISRSDGAIDWKLGGSHRPESLAFVDDPFGATNFGGQHDARILPDGSLTVHDNGTGRGRAPRAVRYRLDTAAKTATLIQQLADPRAPSSYCCGSARMLSGGDWLISWGSTGVITELTPAGTPVLTLTLNSPGSSYRALPYAGPAGGIAELRRGMDAIAAEGRAG